MQRNDWKILGTTFLFTALFYTQTPGLNYLLFSLFLIVASWIQNPKLIQQWSWVVSALGALVSGFFVFNYGTNLPIITNVLSLILMAGFTFKPSSSLLVSAIHSIYSLLSAIPYLLLQAINQNRNKQNNKKNNVLTRLLLLVFPLVIVAVFFFLYRGANPLFLEFTKNFNLDWISLPLVRFILLSFLLSYGFFMQRVFRSLSTADANISDSLSTTTEEEHIKTFFGNKLSISNENFIALSLFIMLNLLIGVVNFLDLTMLWPNPILPENDTFSTFLHTSVGMLIASILLAISVILFFFRGYLNFHPKNAVIKWLAYVWVVQNILLVASTVLRNNMYVEAYGLSHKRIGVFIYLSLAVIGLILTVVKIARKKNNWFLFRKNSWAFYAFLIAATAVNWDGLITNYNIQHALENREDQLPDIDYLTRLSHVNTAQIAAITPSKNLEQYFYSVEYEYTNDAISKKIMTIMEYGQTGKTPSICLQKTANYNQLIALNETEGISHIDVSYSNLDSLKTITKLTNIKALKASNNALDDDLNSLQAFPQLKYVNLAYNDIAAISVAKKVESVTHLNLSGNPITEFSGLSKFSNLDELQIIRLTNFIQPKPLPLVPNLTNINFSYNSWYDWSFLRNNPQLQKITFSGSYTAGSINNIPNLPNLTEVDLSENNLSTYHTELFQLLSDSANIESLNLSENSISSIEKITEDNEGKAYFPLLKKLNLSSNKLNATVDVSVLKNVEVLELQKNDITQVKGLGELNNLIQLDLSVNSIVALESPELEALQHLQLSNTKITTIENLPNAPNLKVLSLANTPLSELNFISRYKNLEYLNLSYSRIDDVAPLASLKKLKSLSVLGIEFGDMNEFATLGHLKTLYLGFISADQLTELNKILPNTTIHFNELQPETSNERVEENYNF